MGAIARSAANLITTSGVVLKGAVNNDSFDNVTALPSAAGADGITLISSQTANDSASISFTSGLTSTYKAYKFVFVNMHPALTSNSVANLFQFNLSTDSGSNYNVTKTTTSFRAILSESETDPNLSYRTEADLAQSTAFQSLHINVGGDDADKNLSGSMILFNPSSTTYVKHFLSDVNAYSVDNYSQRYFTAGYGNTTSAINAIQFKFDTGNTQFGTIYMYGIK